MSIGKSSIARAVNATNTNAVKNKTTDSKPCTIIKFMLDDIGVLSIAKTPNDVKKLSMSISKRGMLCPVLVAVTAEGEAWLIDGYRRLSAAKELCFAQIDAIVINVENKRDANNLYAELSKTKAVEKTDDIHEEKFRVLAVKDHDLPTYLL